MNIKPIGEMHIYWVPKKDLRKNLSNLLKLFCKLSYNIVTQKKEEKNDKEKKTTFMRNINCTRLCDDNIKNNIYKMR